MWTELPEGQSRIEVARDVLTDFLGARSGDVPLGVIAYGHNRKGDCADIAVVAPVALHDTAALGARLRALSPKGKTPLAESLRLAAAQIPVTAEAADIVLVTDGLETCGGDPCAVAKELSAAGVALRAHVVGFGLSATEVQQIACVAEATGGLVLSTQSGQELSEALIRTGATATASTEAEKVAPGKAQAHLTLRHDIAGRPARVSFRGVHETGTAMVELGVLDFAYADSLPVELAPGAWILTADAGEEGHGEAREVLVAGEARTIYVPFQGNLPSLELVPPLGAMRAAASGIFPFRITRAGLALGGADFQLTLLPADARALTDRAVTWSSQSGLEGAYVGRLNLPTDPGTYMVAFHRYGEEDLSHTLALFPLDIMDRPEVVLNAPDAVAPGAEIPVTVTGGFAHADRLEVWKDGQLYSWDQSLYMEAAFDNEYGPRKPLLAPQDAGSYELVYIFSDVDGPQSIAARQPLHVAVGVQYEEASANAPTPATSASAVAGTGDTDALQAQASSGQSQPEAVEGSGRDAVTSGFTCEQTGSCVFHDEAVGIMTIVPQGWSVDQPTRVAATAGAASAGQEGGVQMTFLAPGDDGQEGEDIVLNPHQWVPMNGPCIAVQAGLLCHFQAAPEATLAALELIRRSIRDTAPRRSPNPAEALSKVIEDLQREAPEAAAAMKGLLDAAAGAGN